MIVLENGDLLEGDATSATEVDFTIHGLDNNALKQLADGQLAAAKGTIYTADSTDVVSSIILVNTGAAHNHVNLYLKPSAGTSRRLIAKDLQLESSYSLHFDGAKVTVLDAAGGIIYGQNVSDVAYAASWNGVTGVAPSKNAVYDEMELRAPKASPTFTGDVTAAAIGEATPGTVRGKNKEIYKTASADSPLTAVECAGTIVSNYGMTDADCIIDLPTAAEGLAFVCTLPTVRARYFRLRCPAAQADKINLLTDGAWVAGADDGYVGVASGYAANDAISMYCAKAADGGFEWFAIPLSGTWVAG